MASLLRTRSLQAKAILPTTFQFLRCIHCGAAVSSAIAAPRSSERYRQKEQPEESSRQQQQRQRLVRVVAATPARLRDEKPQFNYQLFL
nr:CBM_HP1_G0003770.mRNA.1.CDS.1 [Saccharomyces cerevisiae]